MKRCIEFKQEYEYVEIRLNGSKNIELIFKEANKVRFAVGFNTDFIKIDSVLLRSVALKHLTDYFNRVDTKIGYQTFTFPLTSK